MKPGQYKNILLSQANHIMEKGSIFAPFIAQKAVFRAIIGKKFPCLVFFLLLCTRETDTIEHK